MNAITSILIAADLTLAPLWDAAIPFPSPEEMMDTRIITHVAVERAKPEGYHYLHETALAFHKGKLYLGWANHRTGEMNITDEIIRGAVSEDEGLHWSAPQIWAEPPLDGGESYNHPVIVSHQDKLWGFFTSWHGGPDWKTSRPRTSVFILDEADNRWKPTGINIPGFIPFQAPQRMSDGNWIMSGENFWYEAAVVISRGDDFTNWKMIPIPKGLDMDLRFPETSLLDFGDRLVALCRCRGNAHSLLLSESFDLGRTWSPLRYSNFPAAASKSLAGCLSTGQRYIIANNMESGRSLLSIAVSKPGETKFCRVWKIRHQKYPGRRTFSGSVFEGAKTSNCVGQPTSWSYPAAVEYKGRLFISYSQGKEDSVLSIIPVKTLSVE